jgi:COMPASS component SWD1
VNAADRIIRLYDMKQWDGEPKLLLKFQDLINRTPWSSVGFSPDGEYIVAGSSHNHHINIWNRSIGNLVKILEGPKEPVEHLVVRSRQWLFTLFDYSHFRQWHPVRPVIASVSSYGLIYVWTKTINQNWSAFAPEFRELEENIEYIEREDEFDDVRPISFRIHTSMHVNPSIYSA